MPSSMQASAEPRLADVKKLIDEQDYVKAEALKPPLSLQNIDRIVRELKWGHF